MSLPRDDVVYAFTQTWWVFILRGILAVAFGLIALIWPGPTLFALVLLFGAFVLVDGIISIYSGAGTEGRQVKWSLVAWGAVGVLVSVAVLFWPGITALVFST